MAKHGQAVVACIAFLFLSDHSSPAQSHEAWSHYFAFEEGSTFRVDGPLGYNGSGRVLEKSADRLWIELKMPSYDPIGPLEVPAVKSRIRIDYQQEGDGNGLTVYRKVQGQAARTTNDGSARIESSARQRTIVSKIHTFKIMYQDANQVELLFDNWSFDLVRSH